MSVMGIATNGNPVYYIIKEGNVLKTINNGINFQQLTFPAGYMSPAVNIAIAPDDPQFVAVTDSYNASGPNPYGRRVWVTINGGVSWNNFGIPRGGIYAYITDIAISPITEGQTRDIFVTTADTRPTTFEKGSVMVRTIGVTVPPPWAVVAGLIGGRDYMAVKVSPNYLIDRCICVVGFGVLKDTVFQIVRYLDNTIIQTRPIPTGTTKKYTLTPAQNDSIIWADIALNPLFNGSEDNIVARLAFVGMATRTLKPTDGIIRLYDDVAHLIVNDAITTPGLGIRGVCYDGNVLFAGESALSQVWYSENPVDAPLDVGWNVMNTPPSGQDTTLVRIHGNQVFAATRGDYSGLYRCPDLSDFILVTT